MFTIDASVHINALHPDEQGSVTSQIFLERVFTHPWTVYSPYLLYVEFSASMARYYDDSERALALAQTLLILPGQVWVPLDYSLSEQASRIGAERRLRGADAVYAAVALRHGATLVTLDQQQMDRISAVLSMKTPTQILQELKG